MFLIKKVKIDNPKKCPDREEIDKALRIFSDQELSIYQTLYQEGLAQPGNMGFFKIERVLYHGGITSLIKISWHEEKHADYSFMVYNNIGLLDKVQLVMKAIEEGKVKDNDYKCCSLAKQVYCVCRYSYKCPLHRSRCVGSHD